MSTNPQSLRPEELDVKNLQRLQKEYPGIKLPVLAEIYAQPPIQVKPRRPRKQVRKPLHVYVLIGLSGILAYACLGLGWLIGAIGDGIYEVGKRIHEAKWRIT